MPIPQDLKYRGNFRVYDTRGYEVIYDVGDVVVFNGQQFVAITRNKGQIPTKRSSGWKELTADFEDYHYLDSIPLNANVGDRWVDRLTGKMYTYIEDKNGFHWVEF